MKMLNKLLLVVVALVGAGASAKSLDASKSVIIDKPIAGGSLSEIIRFIDNQDSGTVNVILSSPGGSVVEGFKLITSMRAAQSRGVRLDCYVQNMAASMAFHILLACDKRTALSESLLLYHRARVGVQGIVTAPAANVLAQQLDLLDQHILEDVVQVLGKQQSIDEIRWHFENETLFTGKSMKELNRFIQVKDSVPGLIEALRSTEAVRQAQNFNIFFQVNELIYISDKVTDISAWMTPE